MAAVKRNADTTITPACLSSASLQWHHYFTNHFLLFYHSWQQPPPPFCLPSLRSAMSSLQKTNFTKKDAQNRTEGNSGWKVRFISKVRDSCCCLTFAVHLPSIHPLSKPLKAFFFPPLWSLTFPSPFTSLSVLSYPCYFLGGEWQKWNFFSEEECWTCQNRIKNGRDVHEILRAIAAALCNVRSVTVIVLRCVHVGSCPWACIHICFYLFVNPPHEEMSLYHKNTPQFSACLSVPVLSRWTLKYYWLSLLSLFYLIEPFLSECFHCRGQNLSQAEYVCISTYETQRYKVQKVALIIQKAASERY